MHILTNTTDYTTLLRPKRLHYLVSLLQHGPAILLRALDAHHAQTIDQQGPEASSWLSLIMTDIAWMTKITTKTNSTQREWTLQRWIEYAHDAPKSLRHQINHARKRSKLTFIDQLATSIWKSKIQTLTTQQNTEPLPTPEPRDYYICYHCGHLSSTQAEWRKHHAKHLTDDPIKARTQGSTCQCCKIIFGNRVRLIAHIKYQSGRCYNHYIHQVDPLPDEQIQLLNDQDQEENKRRRQKGLQPRAATTPAIRPPNYARQPATPYDHPTAPAILMQEQAPDKTPLPPKHLPAQYILMVYQDSRFNNDLQQHLQSDPRLRHLSIISLNDTSPHNHINLTQPSCNTYWTQAIQQGKVAAVVAHTPADTWTILRTTRSSTEPWGQANHSVSKLAKTANFNRQLQTTISLIYYAHYTKTPSLLIHDGPSPDSERPTIWQLPEVKTITQKPETTITDIDLCQFGHQAKHTTRLAASHMPELQHSFQLRPQSSRCRCNCAYYQPEHYTKRYDTFAWPEDLNNHLAEQLSKAISTSNPDDIQHHEPPALHEGYLPLDPYFTYKE